MKARNRERLDMKGRLQTLHGFLGACSITPEQEELYTGAPEKRGFLLPMGGTIEQETRLFEAVFILALAFTAVQEGDESHPNVYVLLPRHLEAWGQKEIRRILERMFATCKTKKAVAPAKHLGEMAKHLYVGSRVAPSMKAPDHWVAYGFSVDEKTPKWLTDAMIPVYSLQQES